MAVALVHTLVNISRPTYSAPDQYDSTLSFVPVASNVRATVEPPTTATVRLAGGDRVVQNSKLVCDPTPVAVGDQVFDTNTGLTWVIEAFQQVSSLGLNHTYANLRLTTGAT